MRYKAGATWGGLLRPILQAILTGAAIYIENGSRFTDVAEKF